MSEWEKQQAVLLEEINRACKQPFLEKVIGAPVINPLRVAALMLAFSDEDRQKTKIQKQMTAAILIQLGLDTHDRIPPVIKEINREHQLIVLAGDYFSGMYYRTLAEAGCIQYVGVLAEAVKKVNEGKTTLHRLQFSTAEDVFQAVQIVEGAIIHAVHIENNSNKAVRQAVQNILAADRLVREKENPFIIFDVLLHLFESREQAEKAIDVHLEQLLDQIKENSKNMDAFSAAVIQSECERLLNRSHRLVEEG